MAKTSRQSNRIPKHRKHVTGQGRVLLGKHTFYTGKWGTAKSERRYRELIAEWIANDRKVLPAKATAATAELGISVAELCVRFLNWARGAYRDDHGDREELRTLERTAKLLNPDQYALIPAATFSRKHFLEIRDELVRQRKARGTVNNRMSRIKVIFNWASDRELVPFDVGARLKGIPNLKAGEQGVRELPKVEPVGQETVDKTLPFLRPKIRDLIRLLRLTAARCGELCLLRPSDLQPTTDADVEVFTPHRHKNQRHQIEREIFIGPQARQILRPHLKGVGAHGYVFHKARSKRPLTTKDVDSAIRKAIVAANKKDPKAKVPHWHPHQLRHARLTEERREGGIDAAQLLGGHASSAMTQRYAEPDVQKAIEAAKKRG